MEGSLWLSSGVRFSSLSSSSFKEILFKSMEYLKKIVIKMKNYCGWVQWGTDSLFAIKYVLYWCVIIRTYNAVNLQQACNVTRNFSGLAHKRNALPRSARKVREVEINMMRAENLNMLLTLIDALCQTLWKLKTAFVSRSDLFLA